MDIYIYINDETVVSNLLFKFQELINMEKKRNFCNNQTIIDYFLSPALQF